MKSRKKYSIIIGNIILISSLLQNCSKQTDPAHPIEPVPFTSVKLTDNFWAPRIKKNHEVTIPIAIAQSEETGRIKNFKIAGGDSVLGFSC